jgi:hypothetical protein
VGELQSALDALAADDLTVLVGPHLLERLEPLLQAQNRIAAEVLRTVRQCEVTGAAEHDGLKTMASWLRGHAHLSGAEASRMVWSGRALEHLPAVASAFAEGVITAGQGAVIALIAGDDERAAAEAQDVEPGAIDEALAAVAVAEPHEQLAQVVHLYRAALDPDGAEPDPTGGRRLSIAKHVDGSTSGRFDRDAVGGEELHAAVESIVQAARPHGDERTRARQNADALVQLADDALASGALPFLRTVKPHLIVTIDIEDMAGTSPTGPGAARTGFDVQISAARARWLARDATVSRMATSPDGLPLDVGREKRVVPPRIRRAVERRDGHCVFAGCSAPSHWCEVHHSAAPGGPRRTRESRGRGGPFTRHGPPRVPDRTRSARPMAHPPP